MRPLDAARGKGSGVMNAALHGNHRINVPEKVFRHSFRRALDPDKALITGDRDRVRAGPAAQTVRTLFVFRIAVVAAALDHRHGMQAVGHNLGQSGFTGARRSLQQQVPTGNHHRHDGFFSFFGSIKTVQRILLFLKHTQY